MVGEISENSTLLHLVLVFAIINVPKNEKHHLSRLSIPCSRSDTALNLLIAPFCPPGQPWSQRGEQEAAGAGLAEGRAGCGKAVMSAVFCIFCNFCLS